MNPWRWETFEDLVNSSGPWSVTNPGPLLAPVTGLSLRRNEDRELSLTADAPYDEASKAASYPPGTVREVDEVIEFSSPHFTAVSVGVVPRTKHILHGLKGGTSAATQEASLQEVKFTSLHHTEGQYTIEWIENLDVGRFIWPSLIRSEKEQTETRVFGSGRDAITLKSATNHRSLDMQSVLLKIDGKELYLGAAGSGLPDGLFRPGFVLYRGTPDENTREKFHNCVSFALGDYLVYLGCTVLNENYEPVAMTAVSKNPMGNRIFQIPVSPPAPLGFNYIGKIDPVILARFVNALYSSHDNLRFGELSWAYWHAVCAPGHFGAAHFGAAIESLQNAYKRSLTQKLETRLVTEDAQWQKLQSELKRILPTIGLPEPVSRVLENEFKSMNNLPADIASGQVFTHIGLALGSAESRAWTERHRAAHGSSLSSDRILTTKNTKLLKLLFHRLLLKMTGASDTYFDYYTINHPVRDVAEPVA